MKWCINCTWNVLYLFWSTVFRIAIIPFSKHHYLFLFIQRNTTSKTALQNSWLTIYFFIKPNPRLFIADWKNTWLLDAKTIWFNKMGNYNSILNPTQRTLAKLLQIPWNWKVELFDMIKYKSRITDTFQNNRTR